MANLREQIEAEIENIDKVLSGMPEAGKCLELTMLELAGVATLIHNFYNGLENIIKQILLSKNIDIPRGSSWHKELISTAISNNIIQEPIGKELQNYLAFRHFFVHSYVLDLYADRLIPLVEKAHTLFEKIKNDIKRLS